MIKKALFKKRRAIFAGKKIRKEAASDYYDEMLNLHQQMLREIYKEKIEVIDG